MPKRGKASLSKEARDEMIATLEQRFTEHGDRHPGVEWAEVVDRLTAHPEGLKTLAAMERSGGEPDVIGRVDGGPAFLFVDCSQESPDGRRSLCYDAAALASRKKNKPRGSAVGMAEEMGAQLMDVEQYRRLQRLGDFDTKTSSWLLTPSDIRELGGAIFGDYRYGTTFVYHNGAESYYAARGFRCWVAV